MAGSSAALNALKILLNDAVGRHLETSKVRQTILPEQSVGSAPPIEEKIDSETQLTPSRPSPETKG